MLKKEETTEMITYTQDNGVKIMLQKTDDGSLDIRLIYPASERGKQSWQSIVESLADKVEEG